MSRTSSVSHAVIDAAQALSPQIAAAADQIEREQRIPAPIVAAMADAGLFHMLVPRSVGGGEVPLPVFARAVEEISAADGSVAWCVAQASSVSMLMAFLDPAAAKEICRDPRVIFASGTGPGSTAVEVEGGFRLNGRWMFASGCMHATWFAGGCTLVDDEGQPRLREDGSLTNILLLYPASETNITESWDVMGLRGTGSHSYTVTDTFVPKQRSISLPTTPYEQGPLYAFLGEHNQDSAVFRSCFALGFAAVALGIARATLDAFLDLAISKVPSRQQRTLRDQEVTQFRVGQAEAAYRSARAFLYQTVEDVWEESCATGGVSTEQRALLRLATTEAIQRSAEVVDIFYQAAGVTAISSANPFERRFRDVHTVTQQVHGRAEHYQTVGRFFLGLSVEGLTL